jgi:membrane-bound lytic murein transglycosylase F
MSPSLQTVALAVVALLVGIPGFAEEIPAEFTSSDALEAIQGRGVLRLITKNSPNTYFLYRGEQMGFEYDLAKGLADEIGVGLEVVVPPAEVDPVDWLLDGEGDLVGASLTAHDVAMPGVAFSDPYKRVSRVVVVRDDGPSIRNPEGLVGQTVSVAGGSRHYWLLRSLELRLAGLIDIQELPGDRETELILADLSAGEIDVTVAETDVALLAMSFHGNLKIACEVESPQPVRWAVRSESESLLAEANQFLEDIRGTFFFNHIKRRYYDGGDEYRRFRESVFVTWKSGRLSRYDDSIRKHADALGVDWILIAALIYEESSFNPAAKSRAGARGLLQIMPRTASSLGIADPHDPDQGIFAGIRHLMDQCEMFRDIPCNSDRLRFALASYNVGAGHVRDAQRLAVEMGRDPDRWDAVAEALGMLSRREFYERARYGFCRGNDAVRYVEEVLQRWEIYSDYLREHRTAGVAEGQPGEGNLPQGCLSAASWTNEPPGA